MATLLQDDYNRTSTTLPGSPAVGGPYTVRVGTWGTSGTGLYTSASTAEAVITYPSAADVDITAVFIATGDKGIVHGWQDASNYWLFSHNGTNIALYRKVAGTFVQRSLGLPMAATMTLRLVAIGRFIYTYVNGALFGAVEDETLSRAAVSGFRIHSNVTARIDSVLTVDASALGSLGAGNVLDLSSVANGVPATTFSGHVYKGRDRKALDTPAAA